MSVGPVRVMESGVVLKPNVKEVSSQCMWTESASSSGTTSCVMLLSHTYCIFLGTNTQCLWNCPTKISDYRFGFCVYTSSHVNKAFMAKHVSTLQTL